MHTHTCIYLTLHYIYIHTHKSRTRVYYNTHTNDEYLCSCILCTLVKGHIGHTHVNTLTKSIVIVVVIIVMIFFLLLLSLLLLLYYTGVRPRKFVVLMRRPLVRDCRSCASNPAGRSGGSLIFGTRCRLARSPAP